MSESQHEGEQGDNGLAPPASPQPTINRPHAWNLYISHAFSTWNARGYEFAAVLFTAAAYPDTLVAAAGRMILIYFVMILFSSSIGQWVERSPSRLRTLLSTIVCNRGSVMLGSLFWLWILSQEDLVGADSVFTLPQNHVLRGFGFALAVVCGIVERLSASGNLISMERDWVVTVAAPSGQPYDLAHLNAVMRRIDLGCKLFAPILISIIISSVDSVRIGVLFTAGVSLVSLPIELISAQRVWSSNPPLQAPKTIPSSPEMDAGADAQPRSWGGRIRQHLGAFEMYFSTSVWVPSLALALLHFNMLTWRATFITYLINVGYSLNIITIARGLGSVFEITSTIIAPRGIAYLARTSSRRPRGLADETVDLLQDNEREDDEQVQESQQTMAGLQRFGLWGVTWQALNTIPVVYALWKISSAGGSVDQQGFSGVGDALGGGSLPLQWSLVLFGFLAFSRLGVWVFDLTTQQLTQTSVAVDQRSAFAGAENSIINVFELVGAGTAMAFPRMEQYRYLALASLGSVMMSWVLYACWVRTKRGHLVHLEKLGQSICKG